jgi:hypothetical protein
LEGIKQRSRAASQLLMDDMVITAGIKGEMPSFAKKLGDPEIRLLTAYLWTLRS